MGTLRERLAAGLTEVLGRPVHPRSANVDAMVAALGPECDCRAYHLLDCPAYGTGERKDLRPFLAPTRVGR